MVHRSQTKPPNKRLAILHYFLAEWIFSWTSRPVNQDLIDKDLSELILDAAMTALDAPRPGWDENGNAS